MSDPYVHGDVAWELCYSNPPSRSHMFNTATEALISFHVDEEHLPPYVGVPCAQEFAVTTGSHSHILVGIDADFADQWVDALEALIYDERGSTRLISYTLRPSGRM